MQKDKKAALRIYSVRPDGSTEVWQPKVAAPLKVALCEWTIVMDTWLLKKLSEFREERLPNETGGVLIGSFDTDHNVCTLVDVLPSPPDSKEWPTSYIRGCEGLAKKVGEIGKLTLAQIGYVGEWHSHPDGASVTPSQDDCRAYHWLVGHMHLESLPGVMLIIGDNRRFCFVAAEPQP